MSDFLGEARLNDFRVICDRSGLKCWASDTVIEWTGARVLRRFSEARHPQDYVTGRPDDGTVRDARPEAPDVFLSATVLASDL